MLGKWGLYRVGILDDEERMQMFHIVAPDGEAAVKTVRRTHSKGTLANLEHVTYIDEIWEE